MFEAAEAGRTVSKADYESEVAKLRWELLDAQRLLKSSRFPLIVLFGGPDGGGKSEAVQLLNEWMDPRGIVNRAFDEPSEDERERPPFWRFWLALPPHGQIGLFMSAWYSVPLVSRATRKTTLTDFDVGSRPDCRVRTHAGGRRRAGPEVLDAPVTAGPEAAAAEAVERPADPLARDQDRSGNGTASTTAGTRPPSG